jgi:hypothetical protein
MEAGTMQVLAWRFDHVGDCNRYGNCVDHPYFELPTREEVAAYPGVLPSGSTGLQNVPIEALGQTGDLENEAQKTFNELRERASILRAAIGEALHKIQRGRADEVVGILENAAADFDRIWLFSNS